MQIRRAVEGDVERILELIRALATYEKTPELATATKEQITASLFGESPQAFCDVVEIDEVGVVGFALWFLNYSTWTGAHGIYLEDLFIEPEHRGRGYAKALLATLARECVVKGYRRFEWSVLDWNQSAIDFYESLGATPMSEWTTFRLSGEALGRLGAT